ELARRTPHIQEDLADEVFGERGVANDAKDEAVDPNVVARIKDVHRGPVAVGDAFQKHFVRGRLSSNDALTGSGVDGDDVLHDPAPSDAARAALRCRSVNEATFRYVCSKGRKWFLGRENCFVGAVPTKQLRQNCEHFQCGENVTISYTPRLCHWLAAGFRGGARSRPRRKIRAAPANRGLRLVPGRREQIATAADGADHSRL